MSGALKLAQLGGRLKTGLWRWLKDWRSHTATLALLVVVVAGIHLWQTRAIPSGAAPAFSTLAASPVEIDQLDLHAWRARYPGRAVALHFWADWCPICRMEEGSISNLHADWPVLGIAMRSGDAARVQGVLRQRELPWLAAIDADGSIAAPYGLKAVPAFLVLDAAGQIRYASVGYTTEIGMRLRLWLAQNF